MLKDTNNAGPFDSITIDDVIISPTNKAINDRILRYYYILHYIINKEVKKAAHGVETFNSMIESYKNDILKQCTYQYLNAYKFGGSSARELFLTPYINGKDVIAILRNKETSIITTFLRGRNTTKKVLDNDISKSSRETTSEVTYINKKNRTLRIKYESYCVKNTEKVDASDPYLADLNFIDTYNNVYLNVPESFYFDNFLNDFCKGLAIKIITSLSYEDIVEPYIPLFSEKIISRGIDKKIFKRLIKLGAIEDIEDTFFLDNRKKVVGNKTNWLFEPKYSIYHFFVEIPIESLNAHYVLGDSININEIEKQFPNASRNTFDFANSKRTKNNLAKGSSKSKIVKLKVEEIKKIALLAKV